MSSILCVLVGVGSAKCANPAPVEFVFSSLQHQDDKVAAEMVAGGVVIRVKSTKGIGRVTATPKRGSWPERVTVLLTGLNELEQFELATGRMVAHGSRKLSGQFELSMIGSDRADTKRLRVGALDIQVERRDDVFAVVIPAKLLAGTDAATISWIDWLRR